MAITDREYANHELREMDEQTARSTLTVDQYERWEKLTELYAEAEETRERWAGEAETVADITVSADMDSLGTEVEVYGNDLLVHIDSDDDETKAVIEQFRDLRDQYDGFDDVDGVSGADREKIRGLLQSLLDQVIVRWDGAEWRDLPDGVRADLLANAASEWGVEALIMAWVDIQAAVLEDRDEKLDVIESFRGAQRGGRR